MSRYLTAAAKATLLHSRSRSNGAAGAAWVERLPQLIDASAAAWNLTLQPNFDTISYNYVAPCRRADGSSAVIKLGFPDHDFLCEAEALRCFDGASCVRLLAIDHDRGAMLLERLEPGDMLNSLRDDVAETSAAAAVIRGLQRPYSGIFPFPQAVDWIEAALRPTAIPGIKREHPWISKAFGRLTELASDHADQLLLHGDLHHDNIISSTRGWLAIDPHGVIGDPAWEIAPFLFNHLERFPTADWPRIIRRRADQFAEELSLDREHVYAWSAVRAIQSAFWSLKDSPINQGMVFDGSIVCAEALIAALSTGD